MTVFKPETASPPSGTQRTLAMLDETAYNDVMHYQDLCLCKRIAFDLQMFVYEHHTFGYLVAVLKNHLLCFRGLTHGRARFFLVSNEVLELWGEPKCGETYRLNPFHTSGKVVPERQSSYFVLRNQYLNLLQSPLEKDGGGSENETRASSRLKPANTKRKRREPIDSEQISFDKLGL